MEIMSVVSSEQKKKCYFFINLIIFNTLIRKKLIFATSKTTRPKYKLKSFARMEIES